MHIFTVAFFGHRYIFRDNEVERQIEEQVRALRNEHRCIDFLVGRNGDFDRIASSAVLRLRKEYQSDDLSLLLFLPYPTAEYLKNQQAYHAYYTDVEIPFQAANAHPKAAIQLRNRELG